jgi:uncharacterized membrane protein YhhN
LLAIASAPWALNQPWLNVVFKPLATCGIIAFAWNRGRDRLVQRRWVLIGLLFSLAGDIALLWPQKGFLIGLVSFLFAHAAYLVAFTREQRLARKRLPFVVYALLAGGAFWVLWPSVPAQLRGAVGGYVLLLVAMAAQAAVLWRCGSPRGALLALGGALFVCSDTLLAFNKFASPLPMASLAILGTYWPAQALIAAWLSPAPHRQAVPHPNAVA